MRHRLRCAMPRGKRHHARCPDEAVEQAGKAMDAKIGGADRRAVPPAAQDAADGHGEKQRGAPQHQSRRREIGRAPSELQSLMRISYAVFCLKKKNKTTKTQII